jgi:hypothetical protein
MPLDKMLFEGMFFGQKSSHHKSIEFKYVNLAFDQEMQCQKEKCHQKKSLWGKSYGLLQFPS